MADPGEENRPTPLKFLLFRNLHKRGRGLLFHTLESSHLLCDMPYESQPGSPKNLQKDMADTNAVIRLIRRYIEK